MTIDFGTAKVKLKDQIGAGIISAVYTTNDPKYVVKIINTSEQKGYTSYQNEKYAFQTIGRHENIIYCSDFKDNLTVKQVTYGCLLLEHCSLGSITGMLSAKKLVLSEAKILQILHDVVVALNKLHSCRPAIAHQDLRAENVLLAENGSFKICDFGSISINQYNDINSENRYDIAEEIEINTVLQCRAPEQSDLYSGYPVNEKVDIWALGVLLFFLCFNQQPFETKLAALNCKYTIPKESKFSESLLSLFPKLFVLDPRKRPGTSEVLAYLQEISNKGLSPGLNISEVQKVVPMQQIGKASSMGVTSSMAVEKTTDSPSYRSPLLESSSKAAKSNGSVQARRKASDSLLFKSSADTMKEIKPTFMDKVSKFVKLKIAKTEGWIVSALEENEDGPNQKYVRYLIILSWNKRDKISQFYKMLHQRIQKHSESTIIALKALIVLHNYFKKGPPDVLSPQLNSENGPMAILKSLYETWTKIAQLPASTTSKDKKRSEYSTLLIINYTTLLLKKIKLNAKYSATFEGNFSLNPFFSNQRENNSPLAVPVFEELLDFFESINNFSKGLLKNKWLWRIQCSLILSVIDEAYCVFCVLVHLISTYKQATNYITVQVDRSLIEKNIRRIEQRFDANVKNLQHFIANCKSVMESNELQSILPTLPQEIGDHIQSIPMLQPNKDNQEFNLNLFLNSNRSILGIKIPLSYGLAVSDINIDTMLSN